MDDIQNPVAMQAAEMERQAEMQRFQQIFQAISGKQNAVGLMRGTVGAGAAPANDPTAAMMLMIEALQNIKSKNNKNA
jgi:hypothetical protein